MEGVRPAIRVRIDQCREKKSYINIYYVDKSIDKSSLARALFLRVSLLFSSSNPQPARAAPNLRPLARHLPPPEPPGRSEPGEQWGLAGDGGGGWTGRRDLGPDPRPSPPAKARGGCFGPGRPPQPRSAAAGPANGWREAGRSRASRPARPPWTEAGIWVPCRVAEPARGSGLIWPSSALYRFKLKFFFLIHHQRNKAPESLSGLRPDPDSRGVRCPRELRWQRFPRQKCEARSLICGLEPRVRPPSPTLPGSPPGPPGPEPRPRRRGSGRRGSRVEAAPPLGANAGGELGVGKQIFILMIFTCPSSSPTFAFPGQPLLHWLQKPGKLK